MIHSAWRTICAIIAFVCIPSPFFTYILSDVISHYSILSGEIARHPKDPANKNVPLLFTGGSILILWGTSSGLVKVFRTLVYRLDLDDGAILLLSGGLVLSWLAAIVSGIFSNPFGEIAVEAPMNVGVIALVFILLVTPGSAFSG
jgi:hypothetical protein